MEGASGQWDRALSDLREETDGLARGGEIRQVGRGEVTKYWARSDAADPVG
jgi:hypothetical protein